MDKVWVPVCVDAYDASPMRLVLPRSFRVPFGKGTEKGVDEEWKILQGLKAVIR